MKSQNSRRFLKQIIGSFLGAIILPLSSWALGVTNLKAPVKASLKPGVESAWLYTYLGKGKFEKKDRRGVIKKGETFDIVSYGCIGAPCRDDLAYMVEDKGWICASVVKLLSVPDGETLPTVSKSAKATCQKMPPQRSTVSVSRLSTTNQIRPTMYKPLFDKVKRDLSRKEKGHSVKNMDERFKQWAGKQFSQNVLPEVVTPIFISRDQISRVYCAEKITKVVYPTDKGAQINKDEHNVYIKIDPHVPMSEFPLEIYVTCGGQVYPMIAKVKSDIPAQKITLVTVSKTSLGSDTKPLEVSAFEEKVMKIIRRVYRGDYLCSWEVENFREKLNRELIWVKEVRTGIDALVVSELMYSPLKKTRIDEKKILSMLGTSLLDKKIVAIALSETGTIYPSEKVRVFAVSRQSGSEVKP